MRLLVVEGNTKEIWSNRENRGGVPYHKRFQSMLKILQPEAEVHVAFPADGDVPLPTVDELVNFDAVLWTGSSLYINDSSPAVKQQLKFAEDVFESGVPIYGSCWGLQIATVVAGGEVNTCKHGREIGITKPIELTEAGLKHPCFQGRKKKFNALCIHLDEVVKPPENSIILAQNDHSDVQAMTVKYKNSEFFGVQYHPEFLVSDMVFILRYMSKALVKEKRFDSEEEVELMASGLEKQQNLPDCVSNYLEHIQEIDRWLDLVLKRKEKVHW